MTSKTGRYICTHDHPAMVAADLSRPSLSEAWPALLGVVTRAGHAATNGVPHGILSSGRPVGEQTSAVEAFEDAPS